MRRVLPILAGFLLTPVSQADILFEAMVAPPEIHVTVLGSRDDGEYKYFAFDENGKSRVYFDKDGYRYFTSGGVAFDYVHEEPVAMRQLKLYLFGASKECPVDVFVDRSSGKILRVKAACDPLAQGQGPGFS